MTRAPLACTAIGDGVAGYALAGGLLDEERVLLAIGASGAAYLAGMALNDFFDRERDRALAPQRPLPSGRVTPRAAALIGGALLALALALASLGGQRPGLIAAALILAILGYDGGLKRLRIPGAFAMASSRALNVLLGAALGLGATSLPTPRSLYLAPAAGLALASFAYIFSLTVVSTYEDEEAPRPLLALLGLLLAAAPLGLIVNAQPWSRDCGALDLAAGVGALVLVGRIGGAVREGWRHGTRQAGRGMTRRLLRGILLLAATPLCLAQDGVAAAAVLILYVPYVGGAALLFRPAAATS